MRGYHPLIAAVAGAGDVVHSRLRGGNANSGRGVAGFLTETFNRARAAGAVGPLTLRADSGFYTGAVAAACRKAAYEADQGEFAQTSAPIAPVARRIAPDASVARKSRNGESMRTRGERVRTGARSSAFLSDRRPDFPAHPLPT